MTIKNHELNYNPKIDYHFCKFLFFDYLPNDEFLWREIYSGGKEPTTDVERNLVKAVKLLGFLKRKKTMTDFSSLERLYKFTMSKTEYHGKRISRKEKAFLLTLPELLNENDILDVFFSVLKDKPFRFFNQQMAVLIFNLVRIKAGEFPIIFYPYALKNMISSLETRNKERAFYYFREISIKTINLSLAHRILPQELVIDGILSLKNTLINEFAVKELYIYGSYARGEESQYSDVDVFVVLKSLNDLNRQIFSFLSKNLGIDFDGKVVIDGDRYIESGKEVLSDLVRLI